METSGQWLRKALVELSTKIKTGLNLDADFISGLVSYCEMASPLDAKEFLDNIVGQDAGKDVIQAYLQLRGHADANPSSQCAANSTLKAYVKQRDIDPVIGAKKHQKAPKGNNKKSTCSVNQETEPGNYEKEKSGKASTVFRQGKACSCQGRKHKLVSNCLSCGKLVCEQEGEGPCNFCGAPVLKEGSSASYSNEEVEAYAKRLVDSERNSADHRDFNEILMESTPITPNPALKIQPVFVKTRSQNPDRKRGGKAAGMMCLDITGRVQHNWKVSST